MSASNLTNSLYFFSDGVVRCPVWLKVIHMSKVQWVFNKIEFLAWKLRRDFRLSLSLGIIGSFCPYFTDEWQIRPFILLPFSFFRNFPVVCLHQVSFSSLFSFFHYYSFNTFYSFPHIVVFMGVIGVRTLLYCWVSCLHFPHTTLNIYVQ